MYSQTLQLLSSNENLRRTIAVELQQSIALTLGSLIFNLTVWPGILNDVADEPGSALSYITSLDKLEYP